MTEIVYSMEKEVERREIDLEAWRERYVSVKKSYDEQLCMHPVRATINSQLKPTNYVT